MAQKLTVSNNGLELTNSQGAGRVFDPPKKFTIDETPIF